MGSALIRAVAKTMNPADIIVADADSEKAQSLASELGFAAAQSNKELAAQSSYIILAVKPAYIKDVITEIAPVLQKPLPVIVTIAAGVRIDVIRSHFSNAAGAECTPAVIRLMPNIAASVGEGMTALCCADDVPDECVQTVKKMLAASGKTEKVGESLMDAVTAVSGSGLAYACMFIEAMADAAVMAGFPRAQAYTFAEQTVKGTAALLLEKNMHPAQLKDAVCSPAGTTIAAVRALEDAGFRSAVMQAVSAAAARSAELGR